MAVADPVLYNRELQQGMDRQRPGPAILSSESRFSHVFREIIGLSPIEYRDYLRIEHAKEYLLRTSWSIERVAEETGFASIPASTRPSPPHGAYAGQIPEGDRKADPEDPQSPP